MDDILVFGKDHSEHDRRLTAVLQTAGATLNPEKCEFGRSKLKFLGHLVNGNGIHADPDKTSAIREMVSPADVSELRRFMGMVNQLGKLSPNPADLTQPLCELLGKNQAWLWGASQEQVFSSVKAKLSKLMTLTLYNPAAEAKIHYAMVSSYYDLNED